jgi:two-component system, LytTR family, sensor kinase
MKLPQYNGKDTLVMLLIVLSVTLFINVIIFGKQLFSGPLFFGLTMGSTLLLGTVYFILYGYIAIIVRDRIVGEEKFKLRLAVMILIFTALNTLTIYSLFLWFDAIPFFKFEFDQGRFLWVHYTVMVFSVFTTLLMEGIHQYKAWQSNESAAFTLNRAIKKSQLNSLRSQVNPHFLFNSLNSLSSLIQEDEKKAEKFLDEMSKVYRYMLREDDQWVSLETELDFIKSYEHVLAARFGEGLQLEKNINGAFLPFGIAALSLQIIIENAFTQNIVSKTKPLHIELSADGGDQLVIKHNVQHKNNSDLKEPEAGLDHLINLYRLAKHQIMVDDSNPLQRRITVPLIPR